MSILILGNTINHKKSQWNGNGKSPVKACYIKVKLLKIKILIFLSDKCFVELNINNLFLNVIITCKIKFIYLKSVKMLNIFGIFLIILLKKIKFILKILFFAEYYNLHKSRERICTILVNINFRNISRMNLVMKCV